MLKIILNRFLQGAVVILVVSALTFALLAAAGGSALDALRSEPNVSEETVNRTARTYGLDQPLPVRYARWLGGVVRGEMGHSFYYHAPVWGIIRPRLLNTLALACAAILIALAIALPLGAWAARKRAGWASTVCDAVVLVASSTPRIVIALVALAVLARMSMSKSVVNQGSLVTGSLLGFFIPALVLSVPLVALLLAQARDGLVAALQEDFVQVARSKGLAESVVVRRHALRAALNPLITIFGLALGSLVSGSVIVETVLGWPGLGQLSVLAVRARDVPLLMGVVLVTATAVLAGNLLADILLCLNDPRLRRASKTKTVTEARAQAAT